MSATWMRRRWVFANSPIVLHSWGGCYPLRSVQPGSFQRLVELDRLRTGHACLSILAVIPSYLCDLLGFIPHMALISSSSSQRSMCSRIVVCCGKSADVDPRLCPYHSQFRAFVFIAVYRIQGFNESFPGFSERWFTIRPLCGLLPLDLSLHRPGPTDHYSSCSWQNLARPFI